MNKIVISSESIGKVTATLHDENSVSARKFYESLPFEGTANLWGDEIYFSIPLIVEKENGRVCVKEGEIAIWVESPSFCIFFGKTPVSTDKEIRAASEVNVIGQIEGDPKVFKEVNRGETIKITRE